MSRYTIDVSKEHCPMTFVKVKIKLATLQPGDILDVTLLEGEPLENVPKSAQEQGFKILEIIQIADKQYKVSIQK